MKAIAYVRVSTTNQEVLRQQAKVKDFCSAKDMNIIDEITDFGISGATQDRPGLQKLLNVTKNEADVIVISELSRLSRNEDILDTLHSIHLLIQKGLQLIFLDDPHKTYQGTLNIEEIIILSVRAKGAADERLAIKSRNIEGKRVLFASNPYAMVDGRIPLGFKKIENPNGRHPKYLLAVDVEESKLIQQIFDLVMNGYSLAQVRNYLHDSGIKTKLGGYYTTQALSKIYRNPIYKGERVRNGATAYIEPLIEIDKWDAVQTKIKENHQYVSSGTTMYNPMRGILRCRCGRAMMVKSKGNGLYVYRCSDVQPAYMANRCQYHDSIRYHLTNEIVFSLLKKVDFLLYTDTIEAKIADLNLQCEGLQKHIEADKNKIVQIANETPSLQQKYINAKSQLLADAVQEQLLKNESEIKQINSQVDRNTGKIARIKEQVNNIISVSKTEDFDNLDLAARASLFKKYIKKINYLPVTTMQGFYVVDYMFDVKSVVAVRKTNRKPMFAIVPSGIELTDELSLRVTELSYEPGDPFYNLSAAKTKTISIQQFFKTYADDYLDVNLNYREQ
ncbi:MAG: recombinase family protein [Draconibacterium sp.]